MGTGASTAGGSSPLFIDRTEPLNVPSAGYPANRNTRSQFSFVGRNRTVLISPLAVTVTDFQSLYRDECAGDSVMSSNGAPTGDVMETEATTESEEDAGFESPGVNLRKRDVLRSRKQVVFVFDVNIPSLSRTWRLRRTTSAFARLHSELYAAYGALTPDFPNLGYLGWERLRERAAYQRQVVARKLKSFLSAAVELPKALDCIPLREFLEISSSSFDPRLGPRFKEGFLSTSFQSSAYSRCGPESARQACMGLPVFRSSTFWVVLRESYLLFYDDSISNEPSQCILLDSGLRVRSGAAMALMGGLCNPIATSAVGGKGLGFTSCAWAPGAGGDPHVVVLDLLQGQLHLQTRSRVEAEDWVIALRSRINATPYTTKNALDSFAPPRMNAQARWMVDGRTGFSVIAEALRRAKFEILISGWWLTPHLDVVRDKGTFSALQELAKEMIAAATARGGARSASVSSRLSAMARKREETQHDNEALGIPVTIPVTQLGAEPPTDSNHKPALSVHGPQPRLAPDLPPAPPISADTGLGADDPPPLDKYPSMETIMAMAPAKGEVVKSPTAAEKGERRLEHEAKEGDGGKQDGSRQAGEGDGPAVTLHEKSGKDDHVLRNTAEQLALMQILKERADAGVSVYVFMWQEPPLSLGLNSRWQKQHLQSLSPNIHVIRHGSLFYTHHAKIVVADRVLATLGGLDVCWGRYDFGAHPVGDPDRKIFSHGVDYYNSAYDFVEVDDIEQERFSRKEVPRMAWHDVHMIVRNAPLIAGAAQSSSSASTAADAGLTLAATAASGSGGAVMDLVRYFAQRWNHARNVKGKQLQPVLVPHSGWDARVCMLLQKASLGGPLRPEYTLRDVGLQARVISMLQSGMASKRATEAYQGRRTGDVEDAGQGTGVGPQAAVAPRPRDAVGRFGKALLAAAAARASGVGGSSTRGAAAGSTTDAVQTSPSLLPLLNDTIPTNSAAAETARVAAAEAKGFKILAVTAAKAITASIGPESSTTKSTAAAATTAGVVSGGLAAPPPASEGTIDASTMTPAQPENRPTPVATPPAVPVASQWPPAADVTTQPPLSLRDRIKAALETEKQQTESKKGASSNNAAGALRMSAPGSLAGGTQQPSSPSSESSELDISQQSMAIPKVLPIPTMEPSLYCSTDWTQQYCNSHVQILRSAGQWSAGTATEHSIFNAYVAGLTHAKHLVYIENQYFLSSLGWGDAEMQELEVNVAGAETRGPSSSSSSSTSSSQAVGTAGATTSVDIIGGNANTGGSGNGANDSKWSILRHKMQVSQHHSHHHGPSSSEPMADTTAANPSLAAAAAGPGGIIEGQKDVAPKRGHGRSQSAWSTVTGLVVPSRLGPKHEQGHTHAEAGGLLAPAHPEQTTAVSRDASSRDKMRAAANREAELKQLKRLQRERGRQNKPMTLFHPAGVSGPCDDGNLPIEAGTTSGSSASTGQRTGGSRWAILRGGVFGGAVTSEAGLQGNAVQQRGAQPRTNTADLFRLALQQERAHRQRASSVSSGDEYTGAAASQQREGAAAPLPLTSTSALPAPSKWQALTQQLKFAAKKEKQKQDEQALQSLSANEDAVITVPGNQERTVPLSSVPIISTGGAAGASSATAGDLNAGVGTGPSATARAAVPSGRSRSAAASASRASSAILVGELGREKASQSLRAEALPSSFQDRSNVAAAARRAHRSYRPSGLSVDTELTSLMLDEEAAAAEKTKHLGPTASGGETTAVLAMAASREGNGPSDDERSTTLPPDAPRVAALTTKQQLQTSAATAAFGDLAEESINWTPDEHGIGEALYYRLSRAIERKEKFKVIIVLPVHPDGPIRQVRAIQLVLYYQQRTISRGPNSLLGRLQSKYPDVDLSQYIVFLSLRNYDKLGPGPDGKVVTEQIYVHSKIMICDDRLAIIGSANINQRSMFGSRDSEVACLVTGGDKITTTLGGQPWTSTVFAHTLRRNLMEEHLGVAHTCKYYGPRAVGMWLGSSAMALQQFKEKQHKAMRAAHEQRRDQRMMRRHAHPHHHHHHHDHGNGGDAAQAMANVAEGNAAGSSASALQQQTQRGRRRPLVLRTTTRMDNAHIVISPRTHTLNAAPNIFELRKQAGVPGAAEEEQEGADPWSSDDFDLNSILMPRFVHYPLIDRSQQAPVMQQQGPTPMAGGSGGSAVVQEWSRALGGGGGDSGGEGGIIGSPGLGSALLDMARGAMAPSPTQAAPSSPIPPRPSPRPVLMATASQQQGEVQQSGSAGTAFAYPQEAAPDTGLHTTSTIANKESLQPAAGAGTLGTALPGEAASGAGGPLSSFSVASSSQRALLTTGSTEAAPAPAAIATAAMPITPPGNGGAIVGGGAPSPAMAQLPKTGGSGPSLPGKSTAQGASSAGPQDYTYSPWDAVVPRDATTMPTTALVEAKTDPDADNAALDNADIGTLLQTASQARGLILSNIRSRGRECACSAFVDPLDDAVFNGIIKAAARHNTLIYERVFPGVMSNTIKTMEEWRARDDLPPRDEHLLDQLVGHVIYYPDGFLSQTQLDTKAGEKEHYLPTAVKEKIVQ